MATVNQSSLPLFERVALVTGGAERVGREIAFTLAEQGCDIIIHYNRSADEAEELAKSCAHLAVRHGLYKVIFLHLRMQR